MKNKIKLRCSLTKILIKNNLKLKKVQKIKKKTSNCIIITKLIFFLFLNTFFSKPYYK